MNEMNLWLTPLILLPGVALLIVSTSARFSRIHDEIHGLLHHEEDASPKVTEHLLARSRYFRDALVALYLCVALFSLASLLGMLAALWQAMTSAWVVLGVTAGGILCLTFSAFQLIRESLLSLEIIEEHRRHFKTIPTQKHDDHDLN